jgi:hypothetical protein
VKDVMKKKMKTDWDEMIRRQFITKSHKKIANYFSELIKKKEFKDTIKELRKKYLIPPEGIKAKRMDRIIPPEGYDYSLYRELLNDLETLCRKYNLYPLDFKDLLEGHIFYNDLSFPFLDNAFNLCRISNLKNLHQKDFKSDPSYISSEGQKDEDNYYPIGVEISPYASLRDILDYVEAMYKPMIEPLQAYYRKEDVKIAKVRSRNPKVSLRNKFIYDHRGLPRKKIMELLSEKFKEPLDVGHIGKIISIETQRRK